MCVIPFKDAGRACSGKADCEGKCFASPGVGQRELRVGMAVKGQCQSENFEFGCLARVEDGKLATAFMCTD
jgi:hypothetical protein